MSSLDDRVIAVTGPLGNLGRACVAAFVEHNARLVLIDRSRGKLAAALPALDSERHLLLDGVDLTDSSAVDGAFAAVADRLGRLDALVHTVGAFAGGRTVADEDPGAFEFLMKVNAISTVNVVRGAVPLMHRSGGGRIVTVAARNGLAATAKYAGYSAAKAAVLRITEAVAAEQRSAGITANSVVPGTIDTPENREAMPDADFSTWVSPAAIASVIMFLASEESRAVSGASIPVDAAF